MIELEPPYRYATALDARALAELVNIAGEGMPLYSWSNLAEESESPWLVGQRRARRDDGSFSYRNSVLREQDGRVVSVLIGYALPDEPAARVTRRWPRGRWSRNPGKTTARTGCY